MGVNIHCFLFRVPRLTWDSKEECNLDYRHKYKKCCMKNCRDREGVRIHEFSQ
jgi:hypothetical protein